jgi:hypothetical protein
MPSNIRHVVKAARSAPLSTKWNLTLDNGDQVEHDTAIEGHVPEVIDLDSTEVDEYPDLVNVGPPDLIGFGPVVGTTWDIGEVSLEKVKESINKVADLTLTGQVFEDEYPDADEVEIDLPDPTSVDKSILEEANWKSDLQDARDAIVKEGKTVKTQAAKLTILSTKYLEELPPLLGRLESYRLGTELFTARLYASELAPGDRLDYYPKRVERILDLQPVIEASLVVGIAEVVQSKMVMLLNSYLSVDELKQEYLELRFEILKDKAEKVEEEAVKDVVVDALPTFKIENLVSMPYNIEVQGFKFAKLKSYEPNRIILEVEGLADLVQVCTLIGAELDRAISVKLIGYRPSVGARYSLPDRNKERRIYQGTMLVSKYTVLGNGDGYLLILE